MLYAYPRVLLKYEGERESVMETNSTTPGIGKLHIDAGTTGVDPALAAMFSNRNDGLMGGGLLPLLIGAFLFSGRGGLFGGNGAVAAEAVTSSKDVMAQLNTFQTWASTNAAQLAQGIAGIDKSICCSSAQIIQAVNALTPQMYQQFSQAAMERCQQTAAINHNVTTGNFSIEKSLDAGFASLTQGNCQTQNLVQATGCDIKTQSLISFNQLAQQLAACCCENRLAVANQNALIEAKTAALQNQINIQTCELKQATAASTAAILEKLGQQEMDALRAKLSETQQALNNCQQTGNFSTILNVVETQQTSQIIAAIERLCAKKES